jgi:hypothetical protein
MISQDHVVFQTPHSMRSQDHVVFQTPLLVIRTPLCNILHTINMFKAASDCSKASCKNDI